MNQTTRTDLEMLTKGWLAIGRREQHLWGMTATTIGNTYQRVLDGLNTLVELKDKLKEMVVSSSHMAICSYYELALTEVELLLMDKKVCAPCANGMKIVPVN